MPGGWRDLPWAWGARVPVGPRPPGIAPDARPALRAVHSCAPPEQLWLWLCQLRLAPYSYDLLDNFGRRSPRRPDPSLMDLAPGQRMMTIFELIDVQDGQSFRLRMRPGLPTLLFGALEVDYRISPAPGTSTETGTDTDADADAGTKPGAGTMLSAVLWMPPLSGPISGARRCLLAWGDVFMMRKQLLTLARLAEGKGVSRQETSQRGHRPSRKASGRLSA